MTLCDKLSTDVKLLTVFLGSVRERHSYDPWTQDFFHHYSPWLEKRLGIVYSYTKLIKLTQAFFYSNLCSALKASLHSPSTAWRERKRERDTQLIHSIV